VTNEGGVLKQLNVLFRFGRDCSLEVLFSYNGLFSAEYSKSIPNRRVTLRTFHVLKIVRLSFLFVCLEGILGSGAALILKPGAKLGYSVVL